MRLCTCKVVLLSKLTVFFSDLLVVVVVVVI